MGKKDGAVEDDDAIVERIFKSLRKRPDVIRCGKVWVDLPGAVLRHVACSDGICMRNGRGKKLAGKTCCTTFRVPIERADVERVARVVDEVRKIRDVGAAIDAAGGWWKIDEDQAWLEDRPDGACVFLSAPKGGAPLCTIHEWAVSVGRDFRDVKPETCCLFPLYLMEWQDEFLVTSYGSEIMREADPEEAPQIKSFDCLHPPQGQGSPVVVEQEAELRYRLGSRRWDKVLRKLAERGHHLRPAGSA